MTEPSDAVLTDISNGVCTLTLNEPESKNSLTATLVTGVLDGLEAAERDSEVRVVVLTNTGNTFCAGANLKAKRPGAAATSEPAPESSTRGSGNNFVDMLNLIRNLKKPVVAKVNGHATGGGVGLVAACDISVMRSDAKIGFTEVRIGVAPAIISVVCVPKMNRADAAELMLGGERITPARAAQAGLINRSVAPEDLDAEAAKFVSMLVKGGPNALAATKDLLAWVPDAETDKAFQRTAVISQQLFDADEAKAGIAAFAKRQPAPWVP